MSMEETLHLLSDCGLGAVLTRADSTVTRANNAAR